MSQEHNLDNVFRNKLGGLSVDPPEYIWNNIEQSIAQKKKKKGGAWWIFASIVLLTLSGAIYIYTQGPNIETDKLALAASEDDSNTEMQNDENTEELKTIDKSENIVNKENSEIKEESKETELKIETKENTKYTASIKSAKNTEVSRPIIIEKSRKEVEKKTVYTKAVSTAKKIETRIESFEVKPIEASSRSTFSNLVNLNTLISGELKSEESKPFKVSRKFIQKNTECYSFGRGGGGNGFYMEVFAGPEYGIKSLSTKTSEPSLYLDERNNTESVRLGFSGGLRVGFKINNQLGIKTGAMYSVLNEKFDYVNEMEERITTTYIRDANGMIIDSSITREIGTRLKTTYNRYHFLDIPVLLTYRVENKDISLTASAGPLINMVFWQKGDIIEPLSTLRPMSITSGDNTIPVFKNNVGVSLYAGLSINYALGETKELFFEPHVRHILRPVTLDVYPLDQRYTTVGASIGLRLKFN